jgi:hypothetical protein
VAQGSGRAATSLHPARTEHSSPILEALYRPTQAPLVERHPVGYWEVERPLADRPAQVRPRVEYRLTEPAMAPFAPEALQAPAPVRPARRRRTAGVRRLRFLAPVLVTAGVLIGTWIGAGALRGGTAHLSGIAGEHGSAYIVRPGDTLWSIATRLEPTGDPRPLVAELAAQTPDGTLVVGETIHLP